MGCGFVPEAAFRKCPSRCNFWWCWLLCAWFQAGRGGAGGHAFVFFSELASHFLRVLARVIFFMADVARARGAFLLQLRGIVFPSASFSCGRVAVFWSVRYFSRMALFFERVFFRG